MNILITGGASGLGKAITRKLAHDKDNFVYFTYSNSKENALAIEKEFTNATAIKCDFTNKNEVALLTGKIKDFDLDILINNAYIGQAVKTYFHKIPLQDFLEDFENNIIPTVSLTQAAIQSFRKKKSGKIITVLTSFLVNTPPSGTSVYLGNKAYLMQLTKTWAAENVRFNITSNSVSPAFMQTNFTNTVDERIIEQMIEEHPLKKILTIEEVADTIYFFANATNQINGADIVINSGANIK